jgi:signal transduction histidine kinase/CheY-like chemotaxis protein
MGELHPQLERQLRNVGASGSSGSLEPRALRELLAAVSRAYHEADAERAARDEQDGSLRAAEARLETLRETLRARGDWLAVLGSGIRAPLSELAERLDLLLEAELDRDARANVEAARRSACSALASLDDVLDWSEISAGTLQVDRIRFDLRAAVEDVAAEFAPLAEAKGLELVVRYDPAAPRHVVGDPGRIRQVLCNLLRHSVTTTREGWVVVDVSCERETRTEAVLRLAVEDSGQGVARRELRRLWEAGAAAPRPEIAEPSGAALGLAVAARLVVRMGGRVGTRNDPGLWSALWFEVELPLDQEASAELRVEELTDVRIMVVDAIEARRAALEDQLSHWEMRCEGFSSGAAALRELRRANEQNDPFRIAILGTRIDGMEAELLGDLIKSDASVRDVDLVLLTSLGEKGAAMRLREIGFSAYLVKPIREAPLKQTLQCVWGARKHGVDQALVTRHTLSESGIFELTESAPETFSKRS